MKITRQRLKNIIMEEIALQEGMQEPVHVDKDNSESNPDGMAELDEEELEEGEGMTILQQAAQTLIDAGILGAQSPEELMLALKGLGKATLLPLAGAAMGGAAMAGKDAIDKLRPQDAPQKPETVQEEIEEGTLEELITQAIQEELAQF